MLAYLFCIFYDILFSENDNDNDVIFDSDDLCNDKSNNNDVRNNDDN